MIVSLPRAFIAFIALLARLVPLLSMAVGQAQATSLLVCPTVPLKSASRPCERSGHHYARFTRTRVFINLSLYEEKVKEVGQWGTAFDLGILPCPTFNLNSGAGQTSPKSVSRGDVFADIHRVFNRLTHLFADGIKSGLLP
ncbi:hypothetical protein [Pseudomonas fragi]|uniref:Uncharacterized protein n=1 Tax=Pseudomonas fragi TaxID=296 RepID=A0A9Q5B4G2_PSEFR|nr:hypothetical protein [Pseudomonas fragi]NNB51432.1 hypothetical protein [Pseudomonas fragi]